jgi:succinyl-diaminopimelate desuccinylase
MPDPIVARLHQWLREHEAELLEDTLQMLRIPSLESEPGPNAPFGTENRRALDLALALGEKYGFRTKDLEGFCGYAEFGAGDSLIVSLGHLDVVPTGHGWKYDPFGAQIDGGYVYARGATDDKGPTMASFYAARAILECVPNVPARIRVVFGCNEESGMECVKRYAHVEEAPTYGVAPDSGWPLYHGEKGIANLYLDVVPPDHAFKLAHIEGGQRPNIVIDACSARLEVGPDVRAHVEEKLRNAWDRNLSFAWEDGALKIEAVGKACHGSRPYGGDNAAARILRFVADLAPVEVGEFYEQLFWATHPSGVGLGIHGRDDVSEDLTSNLGVVGTRDGVIRLLVNVRYPVTWQGSRLKQLCEARLRSLKGKWALAEFDDSPSLYFPLDHPLVKTVCDVVREETGEDKAPGVMGGGTYARMIPNTVSIGTGWEGDGEAHETDERLKVEHLYKMSRIYAHILYRLALLPKP